MQKNKDLQVLVNKNPHFQFLPNGKIKCSLTRHEFNPSVEEFEKHVKGKSYTNALDDTFNFTQFEPYLIPHKKDENKLFCVLTKQIMNKKQRTVLDHVNGKRYIASLQKYLLLTQEDGKKYNYQTQQKDVVDEENQNVVDDEVEDDIPVKKAKKQAKVGQDVKQVKINKNVENPQVVQVNGYDKSVKQVSKNKKIQVKANKDQTSRKAENPQKKDNKNTKDQNNGKVEISQKKDNKHINTPLVVKKKILKQKNKK